MFTGLIPGTIKPGTKCGSKYTWHCPVPLECQGYMGTSSNVMSGTCQKGNA